MVQCTNKKHDQLRIHYEYMQQKKIMVQHCWWHETENGWRNVEEFVRCVMNVACVPGRDYSGLKSGALPMLHYQDLAPKKR